MVNISDKAILGLIPARGGSKSIPLKNIAPLNGFPLIAYVINAAKKSSTIQKIICSTDSDDIRSVCTNLEIEVMNRPNHLAQDETHIIDVIVNIIHNFGKNEGYIPFAITLLQPTSPFVLPEHIDQCVKLLKRNPKAGSSQTVTKIPHNFHAYNQRIVEDSYVEFRFLEERKACYNKQTKPKFYIFGNLVVIRTQALLESMDVFAPPSLAFEIPYPYALDVDTPNDLDLAEFYLKSRKVHLPKMWKAY